MNEEVKHILGSMVRENIEIRPGSMLFGMLYDMVFETNKWHTSLPFLNFPAHWRIRICPPSVGAIVRFLVEKQSDPSDTNKTVSVYFDGYNNLGHWSGPYWEIYPYKNDTARFLLGEEVEMLATIEEALEALEKKDDDD